MMKKKYLYLLLTLVITSCDNKDDLTSKNQTINETRTYIINDDIEYVSEITDNSKNQRKSKFIYQIPMETNKNITSKTLDQSVVINFDYGIAGSTKSGCTIEKYIQSSGNSHITDAGVYGYNPSPQENGYLIRGAGLPHHNQYYNALVLQASNRGHQTVDSRTGQVRNNNISRGAAISVEYPFKANVTYEISLKTYFNDNRLLVDKVHSNGYPTLYAQLKDSGVILDGSGSCETDRIYRFFESNPNNLRSYTLEDNIKIGKTIIYKFSPVESKNALLLFLTPIIGQRGTDTKIPTNNYTMVLRSITITEKPFDSSLNVPIPDTPDRRT